MELLRVVSSTTIGKKYTAIFYNKETGRKKRTSFGARGMDDYTITHDKEQRERYRTRHKKDLTTDDPTRAGFLSYYILWGPSTSIDENIRYYKKKFHL
jgi:Family of unknown function (DUF5754)